MEDALYTRVLQYLNIRLRSEKEIRDYIQKQLKKPKVAKYIQEDFVTLTNRLITRLKTAKFLDDMQFALWFIRSRTSFKPKGKRLIRLELLQKGISKDLIEEAFVEFDRDQVQHAEEARDEVVLAKELLEKKRRKYEGMEKQERFNKAGSMLARRGFDLDTIKQAIDSVFGK